MPAKKKAKAAPKQNVQGPAGAAVIANPPPDSDVTSRNQSLAAAVQEARTVILGCEALSDLCDAAPLQTIKTSAGDAEQLRLESSDRAAYDEKECDNALIIHKSYQSANNLFLIDAFSYPANYAAISKARVSALTDHAYTNHSIRSPAP